jgi:hypothetical protein
MTHTTNDRSMDERRSRIARIGGRAWAVIVAVWVGVTGIAPHVLHHVGPLAGTALVAGAGGQLLFGVVGLIATIPMLRRLHRRFGTWIAPAIALAVFGAVYSFSTFVIGPRLSGTASQTPAVDATEHDNHGHDTNT